MIQERHELLALMDCKAGGVAAGVPDALLVRYRASTVGKR